MTIYYFLHTFVINDNLMKTALPLLTLLVFRAGIIFAQPSNDECLSGKLLQVNNACVFTPGTTTGATQSKAPITCNGHTGNSDDDVWYTFFATAATQIITVQGVGNFALQSALVFLSPRLTPYLLSGSEKH